MDKAKEMVLEKLLKESKKSFDNGNLKRALECMNHISDILIQEDLLCLKNS